MSRPPPPQPSSQDEPRSRSTSAMDPATPSSATRRHRDPTTATAPCSVAPATPRSPRNMEELRAEIVRLRAANGRLAADIAQRDVEIHRMAERVSSAQQAAEVSEDSVAIRMLRRLDGMRKEKSAAQHRLRREEEQRARIVQAIAEVQGQKVDLENTIEQEQEFIVHQLQRDLLKASAQRVEFERKLREERQAYLQLLRERVAVALRLAGGRGGAGGEDAAAGDLTSPTESSPTTLSPVPPLATDGGGAPPVAALEVNLNALLAAYAADCERVRAAEHHCEALSEQLHHAQVVALAERHRAAHLKGELQKAQNELAYVVQHTARGEERSPSQASSSHEPVSSSEQFSSSGASTPVVHGSLVEHTKQILSSTNMLFPRPRRGSVSPARSVNSLRDETMMGSLTMDEVVAATGGAGSTAGGGGLRSRTGSQFHTPPAQPSCASPPNHATPS